jgi:hypothetical protein
MDIIENRYRMIIEPECSGKLCQSRKPHNIKNVKVTEELEKLILELRLNNRFGPIMIH